MNCTKAETLNVRKGDRVYPYIVVCQREHKHPGQCVLASPYRCPAPKCELLGIGRCLFDRGHDGTCERDTRPTPCRPRKPRRWIERLPLSGQDPE